MACHRADRKDHSLRSRRVGDPACAGCHHEKHGAAPGTEAARLKERCSSAPLLEVLDAIITHDPTGAHNPAVVRWLLGRVSTQISGGRLPASPFEPLLPFGVRRR